VKKIRPAYKRGSPREHHRGQIKLRKKKENWKFFRYWPSGEKKRAGEDRHRKKEVRELMIGSFESEE